MDSVEYTHYQYELASALTASTIALHYSRFQDLSSVSFPPYCLLVSVTSGVGGGLQQPAGCCIPHTAVSSISDLRVCLLSCWPILDSTQCPSTVLSLRNALCIVSQNSPVYQHVDSMHSSMQIKSSNSLCRTSIMASFCV